MGGRRIPAGGHRPGPAGEARPPLSEYHRFARVAGLKVRYEDFGQGPPVLLLHGIGHSLRNWSRTVPALVESGFRAISIDTPGFGHSEQPHEVLGQAGVTAFLDEFLDTFYLDQVSLVGHSLGGALATIYALDRPQRVVRLALVAAAVGPDVNPALRLLALQIARPLLRPWHSGRCSTSSPAPGTTRSSRASCGTLNGGSATRRRGSTSGTCSGRG